MSRLAGSLGATAVWLHAAASAAALGPIEPDPLNAAQNALFLQIAAFRARPRARIEPERLGARENTLEPLRSAPEPRARDFSVEASGRRVVAGDRVSVSDGNGGRVQAEVKLAQDKPGGDVWVSFSDGKGGVTQRYFAQGGAGLFPPLPEGLERIRPGDELKLAESRLHPDQGPFVRVLSLDGEFARVWFHRAGQIVTDRVAIEDLRPRDY